MEQRQLTWQELVDENKRLVDEIKRLREALELGLKYADTEWEPADLDRDLVDIMKTALRAELGEEAAEDNHADDVYAIHLDDSGMDHGTGWHDHASDTELGEDT